jgi:hypothetical protein
MKERQHRLAKTIEIENKVGIFILHEPLQQGIRIGECMLRVLPSYFYLHLFSHNHRYLEALKGIIDFIDFQFHHHFSQNCQ